MDKAFDLKEFPAIARAGRSISRVQPQQVFFAQGGSRLRSGIGGAVLRYRTLVMRQAVQMLGRQYARERVRHTCSIRQRCGRPYASRT
jgi:hypothetical protein